MPGFVKKSFLFLPLCFLIAFACGCTLTSGEQYLEAEPDQSSDLYWQVNSLQDLNSFLIIEAAGSYRQIGQSLGNWYHSQGFEPQLLSPEEVQKARALKDFYQEVDPEINHQIEGVYDSFGLDYTNLTHGIPISRSEGMDVILPGLLSPHSCSVVFAGPTISANQQPVFGRNYDFPGDLEGFTLMFTYPEGGYPTAVITTMTPGFTAADGINSEGLVLGFASVVDLGYKPARNETLVSGYFYRYLLEHSASVDQSIDLLQEFPLSFLPSNPPGVITHILIADKSGASAVIEFLPEGIVVSKPDTAYQVLTNNLWVDPEVRSSCERYTRAVKSLEESAAAFDPESMMDLLIKLRGSTQYSVVYDLDNLELLLSVKEDHFLSTHEFSLKAFMQKMENEKGSIPAIGF